MSHPIFRPQTRDANQALLRMLTNPTGNNPQYDACTEHQRNFAPSLYPELDWQRFRPDLEDADLMRIFDLVHGLLFVTGLPTNLALRDRGNGGIALSPEEEQRLLPIFQRWQGVWMRPEGAETWAEVEAFVESLRTPARRAVEERIRAEADAALDLAFARMEDAATLPSVVEQVVANAQFAFLDLPWTRLATRAALDAQTDPDLRFTILPHGTPEPDAIAATLRQRAEMATGSGAEAWAGLLNDAAERIARIDTGTMTGDDGDWTAGLSCCGECAMWFSNRTVSVMDSRAGYAEWGRSDMIFMPPSLGISRCPFCGFAAPNNIPTLFFAENRGQVIYLAPTNGFLPKEEAIAYWAPFIEDLQKRYLCRRDAATAERFWNAAELVTHDVVEFFYAIHMGDTIAEDHVFNMIDLADGSAMILDGAKGFARVITPGEARTYAQTYCVEQAPPDLAAKFADPENPGHILRPEDVAPVVRDFVAANRALDDEIARQKGLTHE